MVEGKGEESNLTRGLEEVCLKKEVGEILVIWREVPPGQRTVAGTEKLRGGIWEEVFQGESRGIQEETQGIQEATREVTPVTKLQPFLWGVFFPKVWQRGADEVSVNFIDL